MKKNSSSTEKKEKEKKPATKKAAAKKTAAKKTAAEKAAKPKSNTQPKARKPKTKPAEPTAYNEFLPGTEEDKIARIEKSSTEPPMPQREVPSVQQTAQEPDKAISRPQIVVSEKRPAAKKKDDEPKKIYILDTNILIDSPYSIYAFDEHDVCITDTTIEELDRKKDQKDFDGERKANVREVIRIIDSLRMQGSLIKGIELPNGGGTFRILPYEEAKLPSGWDKNRPDNKILMTAKAEQERHTKEPVILVSNDTNVRIKADIIALPAEDFRTDRVKPEQQYTGRADILMQPNAVSEFYKKGFLLPDDIYSEDGTYPELTENEFLVLRDVINQNCTALAMYREGRIEKLRYADETPYDVTPRNIGQRFMQEMLLAPVDEIPLVVCLGPAGSAKTFYSLACGLEQVINRDTYRRILVTRPNQMMDDDIGYLKGGEEEKIGPLIRPIYDNLELLTKIHNDAGAGPEKGQEESYAQYLFDRQFIVAQALGYMRGRCITNTWMMIDESQNMTPIQAYSIVTRAGLGSKIMILGDPTQIDNPKLDSRTNGLVYTASRMKGSKLCAQITLEQTEVTRSALSKEAILRMSPKGMPLSIVN